MLENFNEDKRKNSMAQFSDFDSLLSLIFLRCSRTLRFHTGWSITRALADPQGFEPRLTEPKSAVLPLHNGSI